MQPGRNPLRGMPRFPEGGAPIPNDHGVSAEARYRAKSLEDLAFPTGFEPVSPP